ncbi:hypothetical protein [Adhaeribacter arboris]|nr:hypothetical protein [Adhaeribacter arboris]
MGRVKKLEIQESATELLKWMRAENRSLGQAWWQALYAPQVNTLFFEAFLQEFAVDKMIFLDKAGQAVAGAGEDPVGVPAFC